MRRNTAIKQPPRADDYPDRATDCQIALTPGFQALRDHAIDAGWTPAETAFGLLCLALAEMRGQEEDLATGAALARAARTIGKA